MKIVKIKLIIILIITIRNKNKISNNKFKSQIKLIIYLNQLIKMTSNK